MTTKRQSIRDSVKEILLNNTLCGANVYPNRTSAYWRQELPSISVYIRNETATRRNLSSQIYIRNSELVLEIHAEASEDLDTKLDVIAQEVEDLLYSDESLKGTVQGLVLQSTDIEIAAEATTPVGILTLVYQITYLK